MNIKTMFRVTALSVAALSMTMLAGCIDSDYDLGDIDKTIGVGGENLRLPGDNNTQDLCLNDVLDLGSNNFLKVAEDGDYYIDVMDDDAFTAHMWVKAFTVPNRTYTGTYKINLGDFAPAPKMRKAKGADDDIEFNAPMVDLDFDYSYKVDEITALDYVGVDNGQLRIKLVFSRDLKKSLSMIKEMKFSYPQCIVCGKAAYKGDSTSLNSANQLVLYNVPTSDDVEFVQTIKGIDLSKTAADGSYMKYTKGTGFSFHGALNIGVIVKESAVDFDEVAKSSDLSVSGTAVLSGMKVTTATGKFTPQREFGKVGGVALRNVPSFLTEDGCNLDLYDPQLNVNIDSNVPFANKMTGAIVSKDKNGKVITRIDVPEFSYKALGKSVISVRRRHATAGGDTTVVVVPNLCDVIRDLPDSIALIDLVGRGDDSQTATIELGTNYRGTMRLSVASGISLGSEAVVIYQKEYTGWNDQVKDVSFVESKDSTYRFGYIKATCDIENKIPAYLTLRAIPVDMQGREISSDRIEVLVEKVIAASKDGKTPVTTKQTITIVPKDSEAMKNFDGVRFTVTLRAKNGSTSVAGVRLNAYKQTINLSNLKVTKHGKMAVDLN